MTRRSITSADLLRLRWVSDTHVSPDGLRIAYVVTTVDPEDYSYKRSIWMTIVTDGMGAATQFTSDGSSPRWSHDGQTLAFVSRRTGTLPAPNENEDASARDRRCGKDKPQIWLIPVAGGEARQLTFAQWGASRPRWSPNGQIILYSATTGDVPEQPKHNGEPEPRSRRITRLSYRFNGAGYTYEQQSHLFTVAVHSGTPTQLTDGDWDDENAAWSPNGNQIVFTSDRGEDRWYLPSSTIWLMNANGTDQRQVTPAAGDFDYSYPSWSPDGIRIACLGEPRRNGGGHADVFVFAEGESPRCLTEHVTPTFADAIGNDQRNEHADTTPIWSNDGQHVIVLGNERGSGNIYQLSVYGGQLTPLTTGNHHIISYSFDGRQNAIAMTIADVYQPGDVFVSWRDTGTTLRLSEINADMFGEVKLATPEAFIYTGAQGWEIEGWILKPHNFDKNHQYPLLLDIHGGPNTSFGYSFNLQYQSLAAQGYVVAYLNPRGSTSYGREFSKAVTGIWGKEDYEDLMAGVDAVIARGYIDTERMGVMGGSYGGVMTNWIVSHTDRFKAAVTQRSISNFASFFGTSDIGPWLSKENWGVPPWEDPQRYAFHSAMTYVNDIHTPLLIIHSDDDLRCPVEQAEQLFMALKWLRRDVEFLRFEGQNHDLTRNGHPRLRVENMDAIAEWFARYITPGMSDAQQLNGATSADTLEAAMATSDE